MTKHAGLRIAMESAGILIMATAAAADVAQRGLRRLDAVVGNATLLACDAISITYDASPPWVQEQFDRFFDAPLI